MRHLGLLGVAVIVTIVIATAARAQPNCLFSTVDHLENDNGFGNHTRPDCEIAVGRHAILTCTNSWVRLHDKSGSLLTPPGQARLGDYEDGALHFFPVNSPLGTVRFIGDPVVYFDYDSDRFWVVAIEGRIGTSVEYSHVQIAVSTTSSPTNWNTVTPLNPTGNWRKFDYCLSEQSACSIFDGLGHIETLFVDGAAVYIAFADDERWSNGPQRTSLMIVDKNQLMAGVQAVPQFIHLEDPPINEQTWGHAIAVEYDAWNNTAPVYTIAAALPFDNGLAQTGVRIGAITATSGVHSYQSILVGASAGLPSWVNVDEKVGAPSGPDKIGLIGRDFLHAVFRPDTIVGGRLWTCHHIKVGSNRSAVRFYEFHLDGWPTNPIGSPKVAWYHDIVIPGGSAFDPSIAVDAGGVVAISWTQCNPTTMWPEFWMGIKRPWDPPGVLGATRMIASSTATWSDHKADYTGTEPDPTNPCTFWGHSPLAKDTSLWQSHLGTICIPDCDSDGYADQDANLVVNPLDYMTYANRFQESDPRADCNSDGRIDVLDFLCYKARYDRAVR